MRKMTANEIRQMWLDFFIAKHHHFLKPVSLIPVDDPSLLWINSGVATLKPYFDGRKTPPASRLTNAQKAIRTNDIENVGVTARHQTMFEMLGNFSIGDYFKKDAIHFAWELLTSPEWFAIDPAKLYITVYEKDDEAYRIWTEEIGIHPDHIFKMGRDTNFWDVGQGPCGPNTEMFFDRGGQWDPEHLGIKLLSQDLENDRYIEIWNVVFSQFNNDGTNHYTELPRKNIDTGAGLERLASIFQGTPTNFETDLFFPTIQAVEKMSDQKYSLENYQNPTPEQTAINTAFKVIADHVRAVAFAIADGAFPSNKDRGYVIRRLIRRANVYGRKLGIDKAFLYKLVPNVVDAMGEFYPDLKTKEELITKTIQDEENKFLKTLTKGYEQLTSLLEKNHELSAADGLFLFESFGFPVELSAEIAAEQGIKFDFKAYEALLEKTREQSREARTNIQAWNQQNALFTQLKGLETEFVGYDTLSVDQAKVIYMFQGQTPVDRLLTQGFVILDKTPFYGEKGGQIGDHGTLVIADGTEIPVIDTQLGPNGETIHEVKLTDGSLELGVTVQAKVNPTRRAATMKNHSGTHLLLAALRTVLGDSVVQSGSYNDPAGLRMDFSYDQQISPDQIAQINDLVNAKIAESIPCEIYFTNLEEAIKKYHALAFFTEKYHDIVRVVKFGDFSSELCGGTHVHNSHDIEEFLITGWESKGAGVYRIKALTSHDAIQAYVHGLIAADKVQIDSWKEVYETEKALVNDAKLEKLFQEFEALPIEANSLTKAHELLEAIKLAYRHWQKLVEDQKFQAKLAALKNVQPVKNADGINEIKLELQDFTMPELKQLVDDYRNQFTDSIVILKSQTAHGNFIVVGVSASLQQNYSAIEIFKNLPENPKGGGNKNLAQGKY